MNPVVAAVLANNKADLKAVVDKVGLEALLELSPHFIAMAETAAGKAPAQAALAVITTNRADVKAVVEKIGVDALLDLAPYFINIAKTAQEAPPAH